MIYSFQIPFSFSSFNSFSVRFLQSLFNFRFGPCFSNQPDRVEAVFGVFVDGSASVLDYPIQIPDYDQGQFFLTLLNGIFHSVTKVGSSLYMTKGFRVIFNLFRILPFVDEAVISIWLLRNTCED